MASVKEKAGEKRNGIQRLLRILMGVCALGFIISLGVFIWESRIYAAGDQVYGQMQSKRIRLQESDSDFPPAQEERGIDFSALLQENSDTVAWIRAEGTVIDYPVVQGRDNEYYLNHLFTGEKNKMGCPFIDYRNGKDFSDKNTVIYGHYMKNGSMFTVLSDYKKQSYYDENPVIWIDTPEGNYKLELFAGIIGDGSYEFVRFHFEGEQDFGDYIKELKRSSTFKSDVVIEKEDRLVTLVTCTYEFEDARYALFGRLMPVTKP